MKFSSPAKGLLPLLAISFAGIASADLDFTVKPNIASKSFAVRMVITNPKRSETVRIPAWCPGFYFLLDYEKRLYDFKAVDTEGNDLKVRKVDSRGWLVQNPDEKPITITYRISGNDPGLGFFRSHLGSSEGFINGASAFMFAEDHLTDKCSVSFSLPADWDIATPMDSDGKGLYTASGYDEFIDHPIQLGHFVRKKFSVGTIPYEVIWVGVPAPKCNVTEETERLRRGSIPALKMFGGAAFKKYTYFVHLEVGDFNGGLEHRASNVIAVDNTETIHLDALATHEYFHAWNVKQIRPFLLGPFDYTKEQRCPNIWFSEGVTDYYAFLHAYQAGFITQSGVLDEYANKIEELQAGKTRLNQTLEEVCKMAWEGGGFGYGDMSYYTKGLLVGLLSDAYIRGTTKGKSSLDDLMRSFFGKYRLPNPGFGDDDIKEALVKLGGEKVGPMYDTMVRSKNEMPYDVLKMLGLRLTVPGQTYTDPLYLTDDEGKVTSSTATNQEAGLEKGDQIQYATLTEDRKINVHFLRNGQAMSLVVAGRTYKAGDYRLTPNPFASLEEKQRFAEWLKIPA